MAVKDIALAASLPGVTVLIPADTPAMQYGLMPSDIVGAACAVLEPRTYMLGVWCSGLVCRVLSEVRRPREAEHLSRASAARRRMYSE